MQKERDKLGPFKAKVKSKRSDYFQWHNQKNTSSSIATGFNNDHTNYYVYEFNEIEDSITDETAIQAEVQIDPLSQTKSQSDITWHTGRRVVELGLLAMNMFCCQCRAPLHFCNIVGEKLYGLCSCLYIQCTNSMCLAVTDVHTGKRSPTGSYDINTKATLGHSAYIGKQTGKILQYDYRSKTCRTCEYHQARHETVPQHDCSKNWDGSSKAMDADMAVTMAHELKDNGYEIQVVHVDNDAATKARFEIEFENIVKNDDQNHLHKGIISSLHHLEKRHFSHKELKDETTKEYIKMCFMYAIKGGETEEEVKTALLRIVPHFFGTHENCLDAKWCSYHEDPAKCKYKSLPNGKPFTSEALKKDLIDMVEKYVSKSESLTDLGSTQAN